MLLGLALSICSPQSQQPAPPAFDPATLAATTWVRGSYAALPWVGTASAGLSGAREEHTTGSLPPVVGATVDGFVSARYTTSHLRSIVWTTGVVAIDITSAITRTAYTIMGLVYLTTAAAAAGSPHLDKIILGANAQFGVAFNSSGLLVFHYTGTFPAVTVACSTGAWRFFCVRYAGGTVQIDIDKTYGTPTVLTVALPFSSSDCQMGFNTFGTPASAFDIMERMTFQSSISDADRDGYYSYLRARYPSAGLPA